MAFTFLHTADLHLDAPLGGALPSPLARRRREEVRAALERVVDEALRRKVDLVLVAGDLMDYATASRPLCRYVAEQFARLGGIPVFWIPGNHDPALPDAPIRTHPWPPNVHRFLEQRWEAVAAPGRDDLVVHGYGWTGPYHRDPLPPWSPAVAAAGGAATAGPGAAHLVLVHGDALTPGHSPYLPVDWPALDRAGAAYVALGHIHQPEIFELDGRAAAAYPGSPEPLGFGEWGVHGVLWGRCERRGGRWATDVELVPLAGRRYWAIRLPVAAEEDEDESALARRVRAEMERAAGPGPAGGAGADIFRVRLEGGRAPDAPLDLDRLHALLAEAAFFVDLVDATQPEYDLDALAADAGGKAVGGFVRAMLARLPGSGSPPADASGAGTSAAGATDPAVFGAAVGELGASEVEAAAAREPGMGDLPDGDALPEPDPAAVARLALAYGLDALLRKRVVRRR